MSQNTAVRQEDVALLMVFAALALLCTILSGYQAYLGYNSFLGAAGAISFAVVMSLAVLFLNFALRERRIERGDTAGVIVLLLVFIFFLFLGDFAAIYNRTASSGRVVDVVVQNAWNNFQSNMTAVQTALAGEQEVIKIKERRDKFDVELRNFVEQCTDPRNPGMGEKAKEHLKNIEDILAVKLTKLKPPARKGGSGTNNLNEFREFCDHVAGEAENAYEKTSSAANEKSGAYQQLLSDIDKNQKSYEQKTQQFLKGDDRNQSVGEQLMIGMKMDSDKAKDGLEKLGFPEAVASFKEINPDDIHFDKIWQAFRSAFYDFDKPMITIMALGITLLINFTVPLITFAFYKPGQGNRMVGRRNSGGGIGSLN
jgi:uncharacterized membrane protein YhaH (DUF805 family)